MPTWNGRTPSWRGCARASILLKRLSTFDAVFGDAERAAFAQMSKKLSEASDRLTRYARASTKVGGRYLFTKAAAQEMNPATFEHLVFCLRPGYKYTAKELAQLWHVGALKVRTLIGHLLYCGELSAIGTRHYAKAMKETTHGLDEVRTDIGGM